MEAVQIAIERHFCGHPAEETDYEVAAPVLIHGFHDAGQGDGFIKEKTVRAALGNIKGVGKCGSGEGDIRGYHDPAPGVGVTIKTVDRQARYDDQ